MHSSSLRKVGGSVMMAVPPADVEPSPYFALLAKLADDHGLPSRSMGMSDLRIIVSEILPNALPPVIVLSSLVVAGAILFESAVSFLGLGDPNVASWGRLVGDGRQLIRSSWYICAIPGVAIMITVLCLNLIGDGLNDALNPKLRDR